MKAKLKSNLVFIMFFLVWATLLLDFLCGSTDKESTCNVGDLISIPGLGRSPEEWKGYPLQYSGLENSTDCKVHGVTELDMTERFSLSLSYIVHIMYDKAHVSIHFD